MEDVLYLKTLCRIREQEELLSVSRHQSIILHQTSDTELRDCGEEETAWEWISKAVNFTI